MKKLIFVNNNMKAGGVQKSLVNLLNEIHNDYSITLVLFCKKGELLDCIPDNVKVESVSSWYKYLGVGQRECTGMNYLMRGLLAFLTRVLNRSRVIRLMQLSQVKKYEGFDCAISYLHNGNSKSFYGGCNEFVIKNILATKKVAFIHCDYAKSGANERSNNSLYYQMDTIVACSYGCKNSFVNCIPTLKQKCLVMKNCQNYPEIKVKSHEIVDGFDGDYYHILTVARMTKEKGIDRGIIAVAQAIKNGSKIKYHIVGEGILHDYLVDLSKKMNVSEYVMFYGEDNNPYKYMRQADVLLIPSYHEAAPMVIEEAACLGLPVLSTKTISADEMLSKTGYGWVIENDQESINQAVEYYSKNQDLTKGKSAELSRLSFSNAEAVSVFQDIIDVK